MDLNNFEYSIHAQLIESELQINLWEILRCGATKKLRKPETEQRNVCLSMKE